MSISNPKALKFLNGYNLRFDTRIIGDGPEKGMRVKHYVFKHPHIPAYIHQMIYLTKASPSELPPGHIVSDRVFFGKFRLVEFVEIYTDYTWLAIADAVQFLKKHEI